MLIWPWIIIGSHAAVTMVDEFYFHHRRGLPWWERIGHPLDTLTVMLPLAMALFACPSAQAVGAFWALSLFSCLFVTKDEFVHARFCSPGEHWIHAVLFIAHPLILYSAYTLWLASPATPSLAIRGLLGVIGAYLVYQLVYWIWIVPPPPECKPRVDNSIYDSLNGLWHEGENNPVALLRAESRLKNPWVEATLRRLLGERPLRILDVGCGGGLLSNALSAARHVVTGVDLSEPSLEIARQHDQTGRVNYIRASAYELPFPDQEFDSVCVMDFLEHVEDPSRVVGEAARVLKPGGILFFHTFNRNPVSWLIAIKGVRWFVANTPRHMHVLHLFIKPSEVVELCKAHGLEVMDIRGSRPKLNLAFWRLLLTRKVSDRFEFVFSRSTPVGYLGYARRTSLP